LTEIPEISGGQHSSDWWYYFKKSLPVYPGISNYHCAQFLTDFYEQKRSRLTALAKIKNAIVFCGFQVWAPMRAWQVARNYDLDRKWRKNAVRLAKSRFIDPNDLAWFWVDTEEKASKLLRRFEYASVNKLINPRNWQPDCVLGNKIAFHNMCQRHKIPHPQILATAHKGNINIFAEPSGEWIAIKPSGGEGGRGFALAKIDPANIRQSMEKAIREHTDNREGGWLVQNRLINHPALKPLAQSALITARLVTMINESGKSELIASVLRFPSDPDILVDNLKAGALMAQIDMSTGHLMRACFGRMAHDVHIHPVSKVPIKGIEVPHIIDAGKQVLAAHEQGFFDYSLVGWDIVITEQGPIILEGNGKPGIDITQRGMWSNAGDNRFGALIEHHIGKRLNRLED